MAKVDVIMPQMGESIAEGTLTKWLKSVGEGIERDDDLFEISTDKVDADIPAPASGVLAEILVQEGETVEVNTIVGRIETEAGAEVAPATAPEAPTAEATAAPAPAVAAGAEAPAPTEAVVEPTPPVVAPSPEPGDGVGDGDSGGPATREDRLRTRSTPLVRKIAAEHGIDIARVPGTGLAGRVTRDDILAYIDNPPPSTGAGPDVASEVLTGVEPEVPATVTRTTAAAPATIPDAAATPVASEAPDLPRTEPGVMRIPIHGATLDVKLPNVPIRESDRIMEHMLMSKRISAHVTSVTEVDFERIVRLRRALKGKFAEQGVKLTYGPFIYRAIVEGLRDYPILNASVDGSRIVYHGDINLGIAVAINDGTELIVPVLKNADRLSLMGLEFNAQRIPWFQMDHNLGSDRNLDFDDIQGGTFTLTNVGVFGNLFGTPIINQPQVAILGTGVIEKRPVVAQDEHGNDVIAIRHRSYFGLSYDHRVVDGAMAAFFLNRVQEILENFPEESV